MRFWRHANSDLFACLAIPLPPPTKVPCRPGICKPFLFVTPFNPRPGSYGAASPMCSFPWWGWGGIGQTTRNSDALLRCHSQIARKWDLILCASDSRDLVMIVTPPTELYWMTWDHRYTFERSGGERKPLCWIIFSLL